MSDDTKTPGPTKAPAQRQSKKPDARTQLAEMKAQEEELRLEEEMEKYAGQEWFVRCHRCHGVAIFLTKYPMGGLVHEDMWYSDYRDIGTKYIADKITCQECSKTLDAVFPSGIHGPWRVKQRFYQSIKDMEKRRRVSQMQRAEHTAMQVAKVSIMEGDV